MPLVRPALLGLTFLAIGAFSGCTHVQLRNNTLGQARTVNEIHQQQVLDNLAMFVDDPDAMPWFAWLDSGNTAVTDSGTVGATTNWVRPVGWANSSLTVGGARLANENWIMKPINDPQRLQLMRGAYQHVVRQAGAEACFRGAKDDSGSQKLFNAFYTGDRDSPMPAHTGKVTPACLGTNPCWFGWGTKKDIPVHCGCKLVGHHCGTYVWVLPGGRDELTKLTLAILDFAVNSPQPKPQPALKEVTVYLDADERFTNKDRAVAEVRAVIPVDKSIWALLPVKQQAREKERLEGDLLDLEWVVPGSARELRKRQTLRGELEAMELPPTAPPRQPSLDERSGGLLELKQRLDSIR